MRKVAIVTGANRGIGYAIVKGLLRTFDGDVYLTARNKRLGEAAVLSLAPVAAAAGRAPPRFHELDVSRTDSVYALRNMLLDTAGGVDVLVNNAGQYRFIMMKDHSVYWRNAKRTMKTNFWGTVNMCEVLFPLLRSNARVVNMTSLQGLSTLYACADELQQAFREATRMEEIENLMTGYVRSVRDTTYAARGWPASAYGVSKLGVLAATGLLQDRLHHDPDYSQRDIAVNCCCPGYVATGLNNYMGYKTIDEGAEVALQLTRPDTHLRGELYSEGRTWPWREHGGNLSEQVVAAIRMHMRKAAAKLDSEETSDSDSDSDSD